MTERAEEPAPGRRLRVGLWAGAMLTLVALGAIVIASGYPFGTPRRMGAGFAPLILAVLLLILGLAIAVVERHEMSEPIPIRARPVVCILGAILAFGLLIRPTGLYPAVLVSVVLAALAERGRRPLPTLLLGIGVATFIAAIFVIGLNVPLSLFWW